MAIYAISPEGVNALNTLADTLLIGANGIAEASEMLERRISELSGDLGIFEDEILSIVSRSTAILQQQTDAVTVLANRVRAQADEVAKLFSLEADHETAGFFQSMTAKLMGKGLRGVSVGRNPPGTQTLPQFKTLDDFSEKEFQCVEQYHTDSNFFNGPIRAGQLTKEAKLFRKMIRDRQLSEGKLLYRRATFADLNGLDTTQLHRLAGQVYQFSGFMSTTPALDLANCVTSVRENVLFELYAPKGTSALDLSGVSNHGAIMYNEVIFDSPHCRIDRVEQLEHGKIKIYATIL